MIAVVGAARGRGRANVTLIERGTVAVEIRVGGDYHVMLRMRLDYLARPIQHRVRCAVIEREDDIIDLAERQLLPGVDHSSVKAAAQH